LKADSSETLQVSSLYQEAMSEVPVEETVSIEQEEEKN
jgi:hypothetical protein